MTGRQQPVLPRLLNRIERVSESGCWIWMAACYRSGYGEISFMGRARPAHRVSWIIHNGPIPDGLCVCHRCDVRQCVNPAHLFLGTKQDNTLDMHAKGRDSNQHKGRTICQRGHPLDEANTIYNKASGKRKCRTCSNMRERIRYQETKQEKPK